MEYDANTGRLQRSIDGFGTPIQRTKLYSWLNGIALEGMLDGENNVAVRYQYDAIGRKIQEDTIFFPNNKNEEIYFYYPHFVSWTGNKLVVSAAVMTLKYGTDRPGISYCLGYEIDAQSLEIKASLTDKELMKKYNTDCQEGGKLKTEKELMKKHNTDYRDWCI